MSYGVIHYIKEEKDWKSFCIKPKFKYFCVHKKKKKKKVS